MSISTNRKEPQGAPLTFHEARLVDRYRPDDTWGAVRLEWASGLAVPAAITLALALALTPLAVMTDVHVLLVLSGMPLMYRFTALGGTGMRSTRPDDRRQAALRGILPLSRRSIVRARYLIVTAGTFLWWLTTVVTAEATQALTGTDAGPAQRYAVTLVVFVGIFYIGGDSLFRDSSHRFTVADGLLIAMILVTGVGLMILAFVQLDAVSTTSWLIPVMLIAITAASYALTARIHLAEDL